MRRFFMAAAACLAVAGAAVAPPAEARAAPRTDIEAANHVNTWMKAVGAWTSGYDRVTGAQMELLDALNGGILTAQTYFTEGKVEEGRAWATRWAPEQREKLKALRVSLAALSRTPPPLKGPGYDLTHNAAGMRPLMDMLAKLPVTTAEDIDSTEILCTQVIDVIERAAGGERSAAAYLVASYFDLNTAMLEAEIRSLQVYVPALDQQRHPRASAMKAGIGMNESMISAYRMLRASDLGKPFDRPGGVAGIRAGADKVEAAAREMETRTRILARDRPPGALGQKQDAVEKSYMDSVTALLEVARRLRAIADAAERGGVFDYEQVAQAIEAAHPAMSRFGEQDLERRAILAR